MDAALRNERHKEKEAGISVDAQSRKQALKKQDTAAVAISKSKNVNARKLFL